MSIWALNEAKKYAGELTGLNVKSFGAKGDGITNDTDAIMSCIAKLPSDGAALLFPPGVYVVDGISISEKANMTILSLGAVLKLMANATSSQVLLLDDCPRFNILGLRIDGNKGNQTGAVNGLEIQRSEFSSIAQSYVQNCNGDGLRLVGYVNGSEGTDEIHINKCFIQSNTGNGMVVNDVCDININASNLEFNGGTGLIIAQPLGFGAGNIDISGCQILSNDLIGVELSDVTRLTMTNNHVRNNGQRGIYCHGGKEYVIKNNNIHANGRLSAYSGGLVVAYNSAGIIGENIISCTDFDATQGYGIEVYSVTNLIIEPNIIQNNLNEGMSISGDSTVTYVTAS
jgi:parallel beta-helix repeat protein